MRQPWSSSLRHSFAQFLAAISSNQLFPIPYTPYRVVLNWHSHNILDTKRFEPLTLSVF